MAEFRCSSCGAPVTGYRCEYCEGPTTIAYIEMLQEKKRIAHLKDVAENTVIPVHYSRQDFEEIKRRVNLGREIYL